MADKKTTAARLDELAARFQKLEDRVHAEHERGNDGASHDRASYLYCAVPEEHRPQFTPDISADRASAIISIGRKWANGTNLHYFMFGVGFFGGNNAQHDVVRRAFEMWQDVGIGLTFTEVSSITDAELRIGFLRGDGSWSTIGTDALIPGQFQRTMNFGWDITVSGPNGLDTAIHEIGHALGFHHEHQNPNAGIVWNEEAVYDHFERTQTPPWDRAKTDRNILNQIDPLTVDGSDWDPNSVMHYAFVRGLIEQPAQFQAGLTPQPGLSQKDRQVVRRFYPDGGGTMVVPELKPMESQLLTLAPGEQKDFNVLPTETRDYAFRTFGGSDTVMVLFEEDGGNFRFVEGDDDSGFNRNAAFAVRLVKGHRYQLRIRLYFSFASGDTAVMMW